MALSKSQLKDISQEEKVAMIKALEARKEHKEFNKIDSYFPDEGKYRRELYPRSMAFFAAGATHRNRLFMASNRSSKSISGCYEVACHLTGLYPTWWVGKRFDAPIHALVLGISAEQVRGVLQKELVGPRHALGTGMIRKDLIIRTTMISNPPDTIKTAFIKHSSGGMSEVLFANGGQGREVFQGYAFGLVYADEESPEEIMSELLMRTATTNGIVMLTFTPMEGLSPTVLSYLPGGKLPLGGVGEVAGAHSKFVVNADWGNNAPHLTQEVKDGIIAGLPPHEIEARTKGLPSIGSGAIYPVAESIFVQDPVRVPEHWPRAFALDVGWNETSAVFGAYNEDEDTWVLYSEYQGCKIEPAVNASAIRARAKGWVRGVIDPASMGVSQSSGDSLIDIYRKNGLDVEKANNSVEPGLLECYQRLTEGRLIIFSTLVKTLEEIRLYHRDKNGKPVKKGIHLLDAMRYLVMSGQDVMRCEPQYEEDEENEAMSYRSSVGKSTTTGY